MGGILSDISIADNGSMKLYHGIKQEDYLIHQRDLLLEMGIRCNDINYYNKTALESSSGFAKNDIYFSTEPKAIDKSIFYDINNRKYIPLDLNLTSEVAAYWYMGDGGISSGNTSAGMKISMPSLTNDITRVFISDQFKANLGINTSYHKQNGTKSILYIGVKKGNAQLFCDLIRPHIIPLFKYKLPL